jgi:hypothetical protein
MSRALIGRIASALAVPVAAPVRAFAQHLAQAANARAVLFYGSNLRTGDLDGVLDFYVLLEGPVERLWPRVSYHEWVDGEHDLRAKVATMSLATFRAAAAGETLDTTIWTRFVQPAALVWGEHTAEAEVADALAAASMTAARLAAALGPARGTEHDFWRALFRQTYAAEFRVEKAGREESILALNAAHFAGLLPLALDAAGIAYERSGDTIAPALPAAERQRVLRWWCHRRRLGKPYNLVRLLRASTTFEGAARYAAWKIERHTGVAVPLTPWQERHPLLAAPGALWRVWRIRRGLRHAS